MSVSKVRAQLPLISKHKIIRRGCGDNTQHAWVQLYQEATMFWSNSFLSHMQLRHFDTGATEEFFGMWTRFVPIPSRHGDCTTQKVCSEQHFVGT
jgi:hypothetical protein